MVQQLAVAQVERLVVDQQPDEFAVGDVDDRLAGLRVAVAGLGVGQRPRLVEGVQVGAGQPVRLTLVQVAARADVPVGQGEDRLALGELGQVQADLADVPRLDRVARIGESSDSDRLEQFGKVCDDDVGAVLWPARRPGRPGRRRPRSRNRRPGRPRPRPARPRRPPPAPARTPASLAPARKESGFGLPGRCSCGQGDAVHPALDVAVQAGDLQHQAGVRAGGHHVPRSPACSAACR